MTAVDVGRGQLHQRLLADARVRSLERTNIRSLSLEAAGGVAFDVVVADLSFISCGPSPTPSSSGWPLRAPMSCC